MSDSLRRPAGGAGGLRALAGPTVLTLVALAILVGLGAWQLQRRAWKRTMLAELAAAAHQPEIAFAGGDEPGLAFRRARVACTVRDAVPEQGAGTSLAGHAGFSHRVRCRQNVLVDLGWSPRLSPATALTFDRTFHGVLVDRSTPTRRASPRYVLIATDPVSPLAPSAPPTAASIPDNHLAYAVQWFAFAGVLLAIYALYAARLVRNRTTIELRPDSD